MALLVVGGLSIAMGSGARDELISPGPICSAHARLMSGPGVGRCALCHPNANQPTRQWLAALAGGSGDQPTQSQLCLACHESSVDKRFALVAHNTAPDMLDQIRQSHDPAAPPRATADWSATLLGAASARDELACSTCHREHNGHDADLTAMTDPQCQSCHARQFDHFAGDHPEFVDWPRSTRQIAFDHNSHQFQHFAGLGREFDCRLCHVGDATGDVQRLAPFEQSCAACHDGQIRQTSQSGLALFALPSFDVTALNESGNEIGQWPDAAGGDFDGRLPGVMRALLAADAAAGPALADLGDQWQPSDVDPTDPRQLALVREVAWGIKRLVMDMATDPQAALTRRLDGQNQQAVDEARALRLMAGMDAAVWRRAQQAWFPNLHEEVPSGELSPRGAALPLAPGAVLGRPRQDRDEAGPADPTLLAENPLKELIRPTGAEPTTDPPDDQSADPILPDNPDQAVPPPPGETDQLAPADDQPPETSEPAPIPAPAEMTIAPTTPAGPWLVDETTFSIRYQPTGHADHVLEAWIDWTVQSAEATGDRTGPTIEQFLGVGSVGSCARCHVSQSTSGALEVHWRGGDPAAGGRPWTEFSHRPHVLLGSVDECRTCHAVNSMTQPHLPVSPLAELAIGTRAIDFRPITRSQCTTCHFPKGAASRCMTCHNYHIGAGKK